MNKKRYATSNGPVNRRTAPNSLRNPERPLVTPALKQRAQHVSARYKLGAPLQSLQHQASSRKANLSSTLVPGGSALASLICWLFLSGTAGALMALLFALVAVASVILTFVFHSRRSASLAAHDDVLIIEPQTLKKLDTLLETAAASAPQEVLESLRSTKASLTDVILMLDERRMPVSWSIQDSAYLQQCIERYLPDTLGAYLGIESGDRERILSGTQLNAHAMLVEQLGIIQREIARRKVSLHDDAGERLVNQHRFLQTKESSRDLS